jgi:aminoglycoside phosphotransferase (APT) family kinase protein
VIYFPEKSKADNDAFSAFIDEIHEHLVYVLREKFGWNDIQTPEMSFGAGHVVIRFEKNGQRMVLRVPRHDLAQLKRNMLAYRYVGNSGLMPEKIYHDSKCIIEQYVDGQSLNPAVSDQVIIDLAQKLSCMHAVATENYGPLDFDLQGSYADASNFYAGRPPIAVDRSDDDLTAAEAAFFDIAIGQANKIHPDLPAARTRLGHGDLWRKNIIVNQDKFKIIDWDRIGAYPLEHDLVFMIDADLTELQKDMFFAHYNQDVNLDLLNWFALRRVILNGKLRLKNKINKMKAYGLVQE